jgi:hypothetical protein
MTRTRATLQPGFVTGDQITAVLRCAAGDVENVAHHSTRRGGSSRRLLGPNSRRGRGDDSSRAWFAATVHHAHSARAALADRRAHLGVPYANAIDQLTSQATSLANSNDRIVRRLKWDIRHALC